MKKIAVSLITLMLIGSSGALAQCAGTLQYITYDTTVTGGGNAVYNFKFPKFAAVSGTLMEVRLRSEVTLSFGFEVENNGGATISGYHVRVDRNDIITSDALPTPVDTTFPRKTYGPFSLAPSNGVPQSGFDYYIEPAGYILNHSIIQRSVYNTADYLGTGDVSFQYSSNSFTIAPVSPSTLASSTDTISFSITYVICPMMSLASDISFFTAMKKNDLLIDLNWITQNETDGRSYILEKSYDGKKFVAVQKFTAFPAANQSGTYHYQYHIEPEETSNLVFRINQREKTGTSKYSPIRIIQLREPHVSKVKIYPNPGNGEVSILFHNQKRGDWLVDVMSVSGQVLQSHNFKNTVLAKIDLRNKLPKGTYFLRITQKSTKEKNIQKIIVH